MPTGVEEFLTSVGKRGGGLETSRDRAFAARQAALRLAGPPQKKQKAPSLWRQVTGLVTGLPAGIVKLGYGLGHDVVSFPYHLTNELRKGHFLNAADIASLGLISEGRNPQGFERATQMVPQLFSSVHRTGMNIRHPSRYGQAIKEGRIVPMIVEDLGNVAILGSAASKGFGTTAKFSAPATEAAAKAGVAGPVFKGAGLAGAVEPFAPRLAAGLARTGETLGTVSRLGGEAANLPVSIPRAAIRRARFGSAAAAKLGQAGGLEGLLAKSEVGQKLLTSHPKLLRRAGNEALIEGQRRGARLGALEGRKVVRDLQRAAVATPEFEAVAGAAAPSAGFGWTDALARGAAKITKQFGGKPLTEAEQGAAIALRSGTADAIIAAAADNPTVPISKLREYAFYTQKEGHYLTPDALNLARAYRAGFLAPVDAARIQFGIDTLDQVIGRQTKKRLAGYGTKQLDPENVDVEPIPMSDPAVIDRLQEGGVITDAEAINLKELHNQDPELVREFYRNDPRFDAYGSTVYETLRDPSIYPAPWRPLMNQMEDLNTKLAPNSRDVLVRVTPQLMTEVGITPKYSPSGLFEPSGASKLMQTIAPGDNVIRGTSVLRGERARSGGSVAPYTFRGVAGMLDFEARQMEMNVAYQTVLEKGGRFENNWMDRNSAGALGLSADLLATIYDQAKQVAEQIITKDHPNRKAALAQEFQREYGKQIIAEMEARGFEPWPLKGDITQTVNPLDIDGTTPFLPRGLKDALKPYWTPAPERMNAAFRALKWSNQKWKGAVLPFSVRWQIGDAVSNALMAWVGGGINPVEFVQRIRQAKQFLATAEGRRLLDAVDNERGLLFEERSWIYDNEAPKPPRSFIGKGQQKSYRLNEVINRYERMGVFLAELERQLQEASYGRAPFTKARRLVPVKQTQLGEMVPSRLGELADASVLDNPQLYKAIEKAVNDTNNLLGDIGRMSPRERLYVRELIPFWAWQRHLYELASYLAIDHPGRMLMIARIGTLVANDPELPSFLLGSFRTPFGYLSPNFVNPLADVATGLPGMSAESTLKSTSPFLKLGAAAFLGQDWNRSGAWLSRPPGTGRVDEFGRPTYNPAILDPSGLFYQTIKQIPQTRNLLNALPSGYRIPGTRIETGPNLRYGSGDTIRGLRNRSFKSGENPFTLALRTLGVPVPESEEKIREQLATKRRRDRIRKAQNR